ncbi:HDOD domain-containing protein [Propionivibrio dicarboxylicus]|uniref:HD-like signal output (HDOD) domain, no enzymatic activity n=1 Tax=Propionivibrio dicarboxylicus TaxID=83767 RepID=A0A1G8JJH2_9RHOO|nr:HDOD domain-containing protein [Propionivibrio dicarboxylicus]SDI31213.1 HD-like signal output (HDOD) domain, no enzymatic activity [Propionivibrio dicarboxylicus]
MINKSIRIPPQPGVLLELRRLGSMATFSAADLIAIISSDPGSIALLFRQAAHIGKNTAPRAESIEQAVESIGTRQTLRLINATAASIAVTDATKHVLDLYWSRAYEIGRFAAIIAEERISVCNIFPDQAYLSGLFHGCGVPVLAQRFKDYVIAILHDDAWPDLAREDLRYKVDHGNLAYFLAKHWRLPDFVCAAALYQNELPNEDSGMIRSLVAIVLLATHFHDLSHHLNEPGWPAIRRAALDELGIPASSEREYFDEVNERSHDIHDSLHAFTTNRSGLGF